MAGPEAAGDTLVVGLVNNMPDAGLRGTERQFRDLLEAAAGGTRVTLRLFALPGVPRGDAAREHIAAHYQPVEALTTGGVDGLIVDGLIVDGLIVTGTEPRTPALADEPYWHGLTQLVDWATEQAMPTIWSCLAAHVAVLHLDRIGRERLPAKLSGLFDCVPATEHPLLRGGAFPWRIPHSRYNGLSETELAARGYRVLTRSPVAGVDCFVGDGRAPFLFVQGHPEYDRAALLREYRRDCARFLAGARDTYPALPHDYLDADGAAALIAFQAQVLRDRRRTTLAEFPAIDPASLSHRWHDPAVCLYANWLAGLRRHGRARARLAIPAAVS